MHLEVAKLYLLPRRALGFGDFNFFIIFFLFSSCTVKVSEPLCACLNREFQFVNTLSNSQDYWLSPAWASGRFWTICFSAEEKTRGTSSLRNPSEFWGLTRGLPGGDVGGKIPGKCQSSANRFVNGGALL